MKLTQLDSALNQIYNQSPQPKIAAEFYVNKFRFLIISEYNCPEQLFKSNLDLNSISKEQIVGQFQDRGQTYAIVKEQKLVSDEKLNLAEILTARELQIATFVAQGRSNKQIAKQLQISKWTVSTHLRRIFMKLRVDNRAAMVFSCFGDVCQTSTIE